MFDELRIGSLVRKMLDERPDIRRIAVEGMPVGTPGMEHGGRKDPYNVESFDAQGRTEVYARR